MSALQEAIALIYPRFSVDHDVGSDTINNTAELRRSYVSLVRDWAGIKGVSEDEVMKVTINMRKRGIFGPVLGGHGPKKQKQ